MKISGYRHIPAAVANDTDRHKSLEEDSAEPFFQKADILFCRWQSGFRVRVAGPAYNKPQRNAVSRTEKHKKRASDGLKPVCEMLKARVPVVKIVHREARSWSVSLLLRNFKLMILYKKVDESGVKWGNFS